MIETTIAMELLERLTEEERRHFQKLAVEQGRPVWDVLLAALRKGAGRLKRWTPQDEATDAAA